MSTDLAKSFLASGPPCTVEYPPKPSEEAVEGDVFVTESFLFIVNHSSHVMTNGSISASWGAVAESPASEIQPGQTALCKVTTSKYWVAGPEGSIKYNILGAQHSLKYNHPNLSGSEYYVESNPNPGALSWMVFPKIDDCVDRFHQVAYVVYDTDPASPNKWPFENWMEKEKQNLLSCGFNRVTLPGTHNSNTSALSNDVDPSTGEAEFLNKVKKFTGDLFLGVVKDWAKCQSYSVYEQLKGGIRMFDFRVSFDESANVVRTEHGLFDGTPLETVYTQAAQFLDENPNEFLVFQNVGYNNMDNDRVNAFHNMIRSKFGNRIVPTDQWLTSFGDLWNTPGRVLILTSMVRSLQKRDDVVSSGILYNPWLNQNTVDGMRRRLEDNLRDEFRPQSMFGYQFVMTEGTDEVAAGFYKRTVSPYSLYGYTGPLNYEAAKWVTEDWSHREYNVILSDFSLNNVFVPFSIFKNRMRVHSNQLEAAEAPTIAKEECLHLKVRVEHNDPLVAGYRRFAIRADSDYDCLVGAIQRFSGLDQVRITYFDEDQDEVVVSSDVELEECLRVTLALDSKVRLNVRSE